MPKIGENFVKIFTIFNNYAQNSKQFVSVDSPFLAGQNSTNKFVVACTCTVVEIFWSIVGLILCE